jgi:hypothetical protein
MKKEGVGGGINKDWNNEIHALTLSGHATPAAADPPSCLQPGGEVASVERAKFCKNLFNR